MSVAELEVSKSSIDCADVESRGADSSSREQPLDVSEGIGVSLNGEDREVAVRGERMSGRGLCGSEMRTFLPSTSMLLLFFQ